MNKIRSIGFAAARYCGRWGREEEAVAAVETALLFPVMITLLMGVYDMGNGIVANQKAISASQVMADLIARYQTVDMDILTDIVIAGRMAMEPIPAASLGYDIASIEFDDDENPVVRWRLTANMDPNEDAVDSTAIIADAGEGVVVVSVTYNYTPTFSHFIVDTIPMQEVAFLRGRRSSVVNCIDCPE